MSSQQKLIEDRLGTAYRGLGMSRSVARIYAHMTLHEGRVTARELQESLNISAGAVSEALGVLLQLALIRRFKINGSRQFGYETESGSWERSFLQQTKLIEEVVTIMQQSTDIFPSNSHLTEMIQLYEYVIEEMRDMLARYKNTTK